MIAALTDDWLRSAAGRYPGRMALVTANRSWDYAALDGEVDRLAASLAAAGVLAGCHVAALLPNCPEYVFLVHALVRLQAVLVPLNTRLASAELAWQIATADSCLLVCNQATARAAAQAAPHMPRLDVATQIASARIHPGSAFRHSADGLPRRLQALVFTSGTTGRPKAAMLTLDNHYAGAWISAIRLGSLPGDAWLACMPLFHVGGLAIIFRSALYGTPLLLQPGFDPPAVLQAIDRHGAQIVSLVPTMLHRLLELPGGAESLARLRVILLGGAAAPAPLLERAIQARLPLALTYGMTETASQIATATLGLAAIKPGSAGQPLPGNQLRILDPQDRPLPPGEIGQIAVRGPTVMAGYYHQPEATARALRNDELLTGDLGYLDYDGDLWVVQRRSDLIISGGENVYPAEVEAVLQSHPFVSGACVAGVEDAEWGQQVAAAIVLRPGARLAAAELTDFCRERLAGYKIPRRYLFLERLPQTESGKVLRKRVIELLETTPAS